MRATGQLSDDNFLIMDPENAENDPILEGKDTAKILLKSADMFGVHVS